MIFFPKQKFGAKFTRGRFIFKYHVNNYVTFVLLYRLYTAPKHYSISTNILTSKLYENILNNNIDPSTSYNPVETSIQKVLTEPKTALIMFS